MAQVKFYSVASLPDSPDAGGVFFVTGGELYKGASRFGANKVFTVPSETDQTVEGFNLESALTAASVTGAIGGDILTGYGAAKVFNGSTWVDMGADNAALQSSWRDDISTWVAGLSAGGNGSYITSITQGVDGKVSATAATFPTLNLDSTTQGSTSNGIQVSVTTQSGAVTAVTVSNPFVATASSASDNDGGIYVTVSTENGKVTGVDVSASQLSVTSVSAASGTFTNLTVTDTATFSATTVSADTLTVGGSTIADLISAGADARISAAKLSGSISASDGAGLVNEGQVVNYVSAQLQSFDNAMHFAGAGTALPSSAAAGDVYVFTGNATDESGYKAGQEVVYTGSAWEVIGDQNTYAVAATVDASWATLGTAAFVNTSTTVAADATTLPTGGAVATYVAGVIDALAGSASDSDKGIAVEVVTADGQVSSVDVGVILDTDIGPSTGNGAATDTEIPSSLAVRKAIESAISDATLVWLDASGNAIT